MSVVVPAYNEDRYLGATLEAIRRSAEAAHGFSTEIIVVDNLSTDGTVAVAERLGARVVQEAEHNIARVRNCGASASVGEVLVFVDADTLIPEGLLPRIYRDVTDGDYLGGAVDTRYLPKSAFMRRYLGAWRVLGRLTGMAQGATQFCRRTTFEQVGGYDETLYMGEDVDFYVRLGRFAKRTGGRVGTIRDLPVVPSTRRFDQWPWWKTLIWTNPLFIVCQRRAARAWKGWYEDLVR